VVGLSKVLRNGLGRHASAFLFHRCLNSGFVFLGIRHLLPPYRHPVFPLAAITTTNTLREKASDN
jgi:hypothetical protein